MDVRAASLDFHVEYFGNGLILSCTVTIINIGIKILNCARKIDVLDVEMTLE